jgi:hypothetical protein
MSATLLISDNLDGTGGVAVVSGSAGGSTNSVYCATFAAGMGVLPWTLAGSRTGDGTFAVAPGTGYYLWYLDSLSGGSHAVAPPVFQNLTNATQSVHYRCMVGTQSLIQALALPSLPSSHVGLKWLIQYQQGTDKPLPVIMIAPIGKEGQPGLLTGLDDIEYPVVVAIVDAGNSDFTLNLPLRTLWRQGIFRMLRHQRLSGVPEIVTTDVEPDFVVDPAWFAKNYFYSAILFKFRSREPRGFGR